MYYYDYDEEKFKKCPSELLNLHCFLQEVRLWKAENPMKSELGVDYFGVFEHRKFIESELNKVIMKYSRFFTSLRIDSIETSEDGSKLNIALYVGLKDEMYRIMVQI